VKSYDGWWIASDVDGTLIDDGQNVIEENVSAVRRFGALGGEVILASGRIEASVRQYYNAFGLSSPSILYNGARVSGPGLAKSLYSRSLTNFQTRAIVALFEDSWTEVVPIYYSHGNAYASRRTATIAAYEKKDSIPVYPLESWKATGSPEVTKVLCIAPPDRIEELSTDVKMVAPDATLVRSEASYLEVLPHGANKGVALDWLMAQASIPASRVIAVGDNLNDLELLAVAGCGVAVGDGHPELRRQADLVVGDCRDGAVAQVINLLLSGSIP
jgi:Cof subfamily protein (haloacid dehalogenase superfamily)